METEQVSVPEIDPSGVRTVAEVGDEPVIQFGVLPDPGVVEQPLDSSKGECP